MDDTFREYEEWLSDDVEPVTRKKFEKAKEKLNQLMPFENELVCCLYIKSSLSSALFCL